MFGLHKRVWKNASVLCNLSYYITSVTYVTTKFNHIGLHAALLVE